MKKYFTASVTALLAAAALAGPALADPPYSMAPPVQSSPTQDYNNGYDNGPVVDGYNNGGGPVSAGADSVFNWAEVPENQRVPLRRAVFDRGGYQLYDTAGETIVVPFADQNLYVMKFGLSDSGETYFVNTGGAPVLFLPRGGSLENASVPGARWYPFPEDFRPAEPVFLGIAPSYDDYIRMGWYPDMYAYGGYYGHHSFLAGGLFLPTIGLTFVIGGHSYDGWQPYYHYYDRHPAPYRVTIINRNVYRDDYHQHGPFFGAGRHDDGGRAFGGDHSFNRDNAFDRNHASNRDHAFDRDHAFNRDTVADRGRVFGGVRTDGHTFGGARTDSRAFDRTNQTWAHHTFNGARGSDNFRASTPNRGPSADQHTFTGIPHTDSAGRDGGGGERPAFNGYSRQNSGQDRPAFSGDNNRHAFDGGSRQSSSNSSDRQNNSNRQNNAGGRSSGHDRGDDARR